MGITGLVCAALFVFSAFHAAGEESAPATEKKLTIEQMARDYENVLVRIQEAEEHEAEARKELELAEAARGKAAEESRSCELKPGTSEEEIERFREADAKLVRAEGDVEKAKLMCSKTEELRRTAEIHRSQIGKALFTPENKKHPDVKFF